MTTDAKAGSVTPLATKADLKAALSEVQGAARIKGGVMVLAAMGLMRGLGGDGQSQGGGAVDVKLSYGESPSPDDGKGGLVQLGHGDDLGR